MALQARCSRCKIYWFWDRNVLLGYANCPTCKQELEQTSVGGRKGDREKQAKAMLVLFEVKDTTS